MTKTSAVAEEEMSVPQLDLRPQHDGLEQEMLERVARVLQSGQFILGPEVAALEEEIARYTQTTYAIGCASGSDALLLALMALGIGSDDEVITTPYSFFATASAITRLGARPVFVDIDPVTYNINPRLIEAAITARTRAVMPVHLYGQCADMSELQTIAARYNHLPLIEDAAQAIGAEDARGHRAGSIGSIGCFSFYPTKNLGATGDGGMLTTDDEALADKLRILRAHGAATRYHHRYVGINSRLDAIHAAILRIKLPHLDDWTNARRAVAACYEELFAAAELKDTVALPPSSPPPARHIYNQFVIRVGGDERDALITHLKERRVGTEVYYPVPLHLQECFAYLGYAAGDFPEAERAARETLALPIYPGLSLAQQRYVVEEIRRFYRG